ncbi:MAG TPA: peptidase MA family metallohydrolase, partial [Candidatus Limnocylindrales bacterium]|nr:peptidase MA family metallohydrolase [Candidatus Limnocylindrales bacterium]
MRTARVLLLLTVVLATLAAPPAATAEPAFGQPSASAPLGQPVVVTSTITAVEEGSTVEVLLGMDGHEQKIVVPAAPSGNAGKWTATAELDVPSAVECTCYADGHSAPNSPIQFQFRVRAADGRLTFGPVGNVLVADDRFTWRTLEQGLVRVHWYEGDQAFAQTAADVANGAIDRAAELLGSTLPEPVDLFIYATQDALLEAVSPARENIAGEAHAQIQTMFVWIGPNDDRTESDVTIAHELTHLVFNEATFNQYHEPSRWLNEGVAVYLSEGYSNSFRGVVEVSALTGQLIPLQGLAG